VHFEVTADILSQLSERAEAFIRMVEKLVANRCLMRMLRL